jgi:polyhydroxyalkanoate synthesis regulator phasin
MKQERILEQIDKMVASGRITAEEAVDLRAAEGSDQFERAVGAIQARHAGEQMVSAIAAGEMTQQEADAYLDQLRRGDHPKGLRARLSNHRPSKQSTQSRMD